ncbi:hypothetical protein [Motilibacter deserti]|uniref:Uncharacterized protein n=1 Tax=Motilibacter deserti TaxID=2714956 RepID=A0ABX0GWF4_9ACTN|nr:hypothetical protein [Motilibacter deserti]NHC13593.1 hypothetical protein [Motilibacter deserti]
MDADYVIAQAYLMGLRAEAAGQRRARAAGPTTASRARGPHLGLRRGLRRGAWRRAGRAAAPPATAGEVVCLRAAAGARA